MPNSTDPTKQSESRRFQCRHVRANGKRCGMASLRGESFCYYHHATRRPAPDPRTDIQPESSILQLGLIEDRASIQIALNHVIARIAANQIDPRRAGLILYALQIASSTLRRDARTRAAHSGDDAGNDPENQYEPPDSVPAYPIDILIDPDLGPLAPIAEVIPPEAARTSLIQRFLDDVNRPKIPCARCEEADRLEAARVLVATLPIIQASADDATNPGAPFGVPGERSLLAGVTRLASETWESSATDLDTPCQTASPSDVGIPHSHILHTLHAVATSDPAAPPRRRCRSLRTATLTRQPADAQPRDPAPPAPAEEIARRASRIARTFRHRIYTEARG